MNLISDNLIWKSVAVIGVGTMFLPHPVDLGNKILRVFFSTLWSAASDPVKEYVDPKIRTLNEKIDTFNMNLANLNAKIDNLDAKGAGGRARELFREFLEGMGYEEGAIGNAGGSTLSTETKAFLRSLAIALGIDPESGPTEVILQLWDKFHTDQLSGKFIETVNTFIQTIAQDQGWKEQISIIVEEVETVIRETTPQIGNVAREGITNIGKEVLKGVNYDLLPYVLMTITALFATPLTVYYLYQKASHQIGSPQLATETYQHTIFTERVENAASAIFGIKPNAEKKKMPVFNPEITRRILDLNSSTQHIRKNGGFFQNVLFYGPGGTGKTMISEYLAANSGMSYIKMSGGDLAQYIKRGEHVTELNKLMDKMNLSWRPWSARPWILYIDEADSLCRNRSEIPSAELLELQNALLNRTGTQSTKFMLILSTNRMEDMDEAILTRLDHKIYIGPPAESERFKIIKSYLPQFFLASEQKAFFTDPQVQKIAKETNGLTGRALFKLLNVIANKKFATPNRKLTQPMVDQSLRDIIGQEKELERRRALKEAKSRIPAPPTRRLAR